MAPGGTNEIIYPNSLYFGYSTSPHIALTHGKARQWIAYRELEFQTDPYCSDVDDSVTYYLNEPYTRIANNTPRRQSWI